MKEEKISTRQLWFILFIMRSVLIVSFLSVLTSGNALQDVWISAILVLIGSEVFVVLFSLLDIRFQNSNLIEYSQKILGTWMGKLLGLLFLWIFLQLSTIEIRIYGELLSANFLPETPLTVIISGMIFVSMICIYSGVEVLGRMADFLFPLFCIMILSIMIIPLPDIDWNNLQPVFQRGWNPIISGILTSIVFISQIWVLGMLSPNLVGGKKFWLPVTAIAVSLFLLILMSIIVVGVLGPYEGARSSFPILTLMRSVELSQFLQRTETLIIFSWGMGLFISVSTFLYCGAKGMAQWLNLIDYRPLVFPMGTFWIFLSIYSFEDMFVLYTFLSPEIFAPYGLILLVIPLFILWIGYGIKVISGKK
ncbi:MAG: GerAB/ArcD/ProY family transporter [Halanaerobiales bacterium]